ncbi:MAG: hypothetical protein IJK77_08335 [Lachnospiraceae bacterium]|nr:hypothetical protein [Lachnospiraceae bacterium]
MKRIIALMTALLLVLLLGGCAKYSLPQGAFCNAEGSDAEIPLSQEAKEYIIGLLNSGTWMNDLTQCASDYYFHTAKQELRYHSDCGTFNDGTNRRSLTVSGEEKETINAWLHAAEEKARGSEK